MANWSTLKAAIANAIKTNGNQEITGQLLQNVLNNIVSSVGENSTFAGIATPATNPGAPDGPVFYFATQAGTYTNFGTVELNEGLNILLWNGASWAATNVMTIAQGIGKSENAVMSQKAITDKLTELEGEFQKQLKYFSVSENNISVTIESRVLRFVLNSGAYLFLKTNNYNQINYIPLPECNIEISGDKVIAFSDTNNTYTPCTYGSEIYIVSTERNNVSYIDVIVGINVTQIYSNYPVILDAYYKSLSDDSLQELADEIKPTIQDNIKSIDTLKAEINSLDVRSWDWKEITETAVLTSGVVIPVPITFGYISFDIYTMNTSDVTLSLYTKSDDDVFTKDKDIYTFKPAESRIISSHLIQEKVDATEHEYYLGITTGGIGYISSAKPDGEFRLLANNRTYYGLCFSFSISGELANNVSQLQKEQSIIENNVQNLSDKVSTIFEDKEIEDNEYWVKVQGNMFKSEELYLSGNAEILNNTISLPSSNSYVAVNKMYWSNRRIHKFYVTPSTLGTLTVNMAKNKENDMYSSFTGGNWTSKFKIDFLNKKIYMANDISFDLDMEFIQGRKYIVEFKYIRRVFTVTITDFLTQESCNVVLDTTEKNQNGGFKNTFIIINESGNYVVENIETFEVANPTLVLFGDSVTEAIGRVGKGQNYSEIISEKIKSCTIIAQGGAGMGSWNNIFENEIKYIKPKYCSFHMGLNGGFDNTQLEKFITDCESIGSIPILNHVICNTQIGTDNTQETYNSILDGVVVEKGYAGYYGDIATATNNDIASQSNYLANNAADGKFNIKKTAMSKDCFKTYTIAAGKTVIEDEEERVLDSPLEVIIDTHPKAAGHEVMADRYLKEVHIV